MTTGRAAALKKQIEGILQKSYNWLAWNSALEAAFVLEGRERELFFCVDASEVVEYLLPSSLRNASYPTSLDLSLLIIFKPGRKLFVLPPHLLELKSQSNIWSERLRVASQQLNLLREAAPDLEELDRLRAGEPGEQVLDQLVDYILSERKLFRQVLSLPAQQGKSMDALIHRLAFPDQAALGLGDWRYVPAPGRVELWYEKLSTSKVGRGGPPSHLVDAHALHMIELLNQALPGHCFLLLSTQSEKIWEAIGKAREIDSEVLTKDGVSLVQRPQLALVHALLGEQGAEARNRERLIVEKERGGGLGEMRRRLEKDILPLLGQDDSKQLDFTEIEQLVQDLDEGIKRLDSVSQDKQWIERLRLAFDPSVEQTEGSVREQFLGAMQDDRREAMQEVLSRRLGELIEELEDLQQRLSLAAAATPSPPVSFESFKDVENEEPSYGIRGILNSQPGGQAYTLRFQSRTLPDHLLRIQALLQDLDRARDDPERMQLSSSLQQEMYRCEVQHRSEPEYYLLLSLVFSSRQMWFQSYDAADQGLKMIWGKEGPDESSTPAPAAASATTELLFAEAAAFTNWILERYADLPVVAARFLGRAAGMARRSLRLQQRWAAVLPHAGELDPRCLRELGKIYGTAREGKIPLEVDPGDRELAGLPAEPPPDLLDAFLGLARLAYHWGREDTRMRGHYINSLLYAMTEKDSPRELEERRHLADALAAEEALAGDPNLLDTLAWHHFRLARRLQQEGKPFEGELRTAHERIESAFALFKRNRRRPGNRYYERLIERHHREISEAWKQRR